MNPVRRVYIGIAIGVVVTLLAPVERVASVLQPMVEVILNIGRYIFIPTMFFGIVAGFAHRIKEPSQSNRGTGMIPHITEQKQHKNMYVYTFLILLLTTTLLTVIGGGVLLISLPRLSIIFQEFQPITPLGVNQVFSLTFPKSLFSVFAQPGDFILPIVVVAIVFGTAMKHRLGENSIVPTASIEISNMFNFLLNVYINFLGVGMIIISSYLVVQMRTVADIKLFYQFIVVIAALTAAIIFVVYPAIALLLKCKVRPTRLIPKILSATLVSAISGDSYFSSIMVLRLFRSIFPSNRGTPYALTAIGMLFSKAGSAFVASAVFFMVLQSYTAIEVTFLNTVWVMATIILLSPLASASPRLGVVHILVAVATLYGNGLENGFLIIVPILPLLIAISVLLDTFTIVFFGYLLADKLGLSVTLMGGLGTTTPTHGMTKQTGVVTSSQ